MSIPQIIEQEMTVLCLLCHTKRGRPYIPTKNGTMTYICSECLDKEIERIESEIRKMGLEWMNRDS